MKKILYSALAACSLFAFASCSSDEPAQLSGDGEVLISVKLPAEVTRAFGNGHSASQLQYAVYEGTDNTPIINNTIQNAFNADLEHEMTLKLVTGKSYNIIFWAQDPTCTAYTFNATDKTIDVTYEDRGATGETRDAFFASDSFTVSGAATREIILTRPFSQINIGTDDLNEEAVANMKETLQTYFTTKAYSTLNLETGVATGQEEITLPAAGRPVEADEPFPVDGYNYLSCDYILVNNEEAIQQFDIFFLENADAEPFNTITIANVPVNRNWRTNIYGSLLTSDQLFNIEIDPIFNGEYQVVSSASALQSAVEKGDNVVLFGNIPNAGELNVAGDVTIDLNGYNLGNAYILASGSATKLTIKGEGTVTGGQKDGGVVNATKGATVTIESGNYVGGIDAAGYTNSCIFAMGGNVIINGGTFKCQLPYNGKWYVLNVQNNSAGTITCNGGVFYNQNPELGDDHDKGSFLGEGCTMTESTEGDDTIYTVTK